MHLDMELLFVKDSETRMRISFKPCMLNDMLVMSLPRLNLEYRALFL